MQSLKDHATPIILALAGLASIGFTWAGWFFRRLLLDIKEKIAELCASMHKQALACKDNQRTCREELCRTLASKEDLIDAKNELRAWKIARSGLKDEIRNELYTALDHHSHGPDGKVQRG